MSINKLLNLANKFETKMSKTAAQSSYESFQHITRIYDLDKKFSDAIFRSYDPKIEDLVNKSNTVLEFCTNIYNKARTQSLSALDANLFAQSVPGALADVEKALPVVANAENYRTIKNLFDLLKDKISTYQPVAILQPQITKEFKDYVLTVLYDKVQGYNEQNPPAKDFKNLVSQLLKASRSNTVEAATLRKAMYSSLSNVDIPTLDTIIGTNIDLVLSSGPNTQSTQVTSTRPATKEQQLGKAVSQKPPVSGSGAPAVDPTKVRPTTSGL